MLLLEGDRRYEHPQPAASDAAGTVVGVASVSEGAFHYQIPLDVPQGRMGVQPSVALNYNSRGDAGPAGYGWSVNAGSSIKRCRKTLATHGINETVRFDRSDSFCLDDRKLHLVSGEYGDAGSEYRTDSATFSKVVARGSLQEGAPAWFEVYTKAGRILEYGRTPNSRGSAVLGQDVPSPHLGVDGDTGTSSHIDGPRDNWLSNVTLSWELRSVRDRHGNAMAYEYVEAAPGSSQRLVSKIRYTGTYDDGDVVGTKREVRFIYDTFGPANESWLGGVRTHWSKRLESVEMHAPFPDATALAWRYVLAQSESDATERSLLRWITKCDAGNACLPATVFTSDEQPLEYERIETPRMALHPARDGWTRLVLADLDGDGGDDLVYNAQEGLEWEPDAETKLLVRRSATSGRALGTQPFHPETDSSASALILPEGPALLSSGIYPIDLTPDPGLELVSRQQDETCSGGPSCVRTETLDWDGSALTRVGRLYVPFQATSHQVVLGDMSGDGLPDAVFERCSDGGYTFGLNDRSPNPIQGLNQSETPIVGGCILEDRGWFADFHGDGQPEFVGGLDDHITYFLHRDRHGNDAWQSLSWDVPMAGLWDFNGDGLPDLPSVDLDDFGMRYNTGVGLAAAGPDINLVGDPPLVPFGDEKEDILLADFDGDGQTDVLRLVLEDNPATNSVDGGVSSFDRGPALLFRRTLAFTGTELPRAGWRLKHEADSSNRLHWSGVAVGDINGDGLLEIAQVTYDRGWYSFDYNEPYERTYPGGVYQPATATPIIEVLSPRRVGRPDKLVEVRDGLGRRDLVTYVPGTDPDVVTLSECEYPQRCTGRGLEVVKEWAVIPNQGSESSSLYEFSYEGPRFDLRGRGFLGFDAIVRRDVLHGEELRDEFYPEFIFSMCPGEVAPFASAPVRSVATTPYNDGSGKSRRITTDRTYCLRALDYSPITDQSFTDLSDYFDHAHGGDRFPTFVESTECLADSDDPPVAFAECQAFQEFSYAVELTRANEVTVELTGAGVEAGPRLEHRQLYEYDLYGNVVEEHVRQRLIQGATIEQESLETSRTFQTSTSEWLHGLQTDVTLHSQVDGLGRTRRTTASYDPVNGSLTTVVVQPDEDDDQKRTVQFNYLGNGLPLAISETAVGQATRSVSLTFDSEGVFPRSVINSEGHEVTTFHHPSLGTLAAEFDPNGALSEFILDGFGRAVTMKLPDGYEESTEFSVPVSGVEDYSVEVSANTGERSVTTFDGLGRATESSWRHFDGSTQHLYVAYVDHAREVWRSLPGGLNDPPVWRTQTFDGAGRLVEAANADGSRRRTEYPDLTRIREEDEEGRETVTTLDVAGRVRSTTTVMPGDDLETLYSYWPFGAVMKVQEPGGEITWNYIDELGRTVQVASPSTGVHSYRYNPWGELIEETNAVRTVVTDRDRLGRPEQILYTSTTATPDTRRTSFAYDACVGGIGQVCLIDGEDLVDQESTLMQFHYDDLGRIVRKKWSVGSLADDQFDVEYAYDAFGRLESTWYPETPSLFGTTRFHVENQYQNGFLETVRADGHVVWQADAYASHGALERANWGNGVLERRDYDPDRRRLTSLRRDSSAEQEETLYSYLWNGEVSGRVHMHTTYGQGTSTAEDVYGYDPAGRLIKWQGSGARDVDVGYAYNASGGLTTVGVDALGSAAPGVETYAYAVGNPHQIRSFTGLDGISHTDFGYDGAGRATLAYVHDSVGALALTLGVFDLPLSAMNDDVRAEFEYDGLGQRLVKWTQDTSVAEETVYIDDLYERRDGERHVFHVFAGTQRIAHWTFDESDESEEMLYLGVDSLSTISTVWGADGTVAERLEYDPWGARMDRDGTPDWGHAKTDVTRGFTGHEHDDDLAVINMMARLYSPGLRVFLSPDPLAGVGLQSPILCATGDCADGGTTDTRIGRSRVGAYGQRPKQGSSLGSASSAGSMTVNHLTSRALGAGAAPNMGGATPPSTGWMQAPGAVVGEASQLNRYAYVRNNPVRMTDPTGLWPTMDDLGEVAAAGVQWVGDAGAAYKDRLVQVANSALATGAAAPTTPGQVIKTLEVFIHGFKEDPGMNMAQAKFVHEQVEGLIDGFLGRMRGDPEAWGSNAADATVLAATARIFGFGRQCFAAGTLVNAEAGLVPIEDIQVGDLVWARDADTGELALKPVVRTFEREAPELLLLTFSGPEGRTERVGVTAEHPFFVDGRWTAAGRLGPASLVAQLDASDGVSVVAVEALGATMVYNLEVAEYHTYFVGEAGLWAHNTCARFDPARADHIFRDAGGHVNPGGAGSRARFARLFERVASESGNLRPDAVQARLITQHAADAGVRAYTWTGKMGQVWVTVRDGVIQNAGVNPIGAFR